MTIKVDHALLKKRARLPTSTRSECNERSPYGAMPRMFLTARREKLFHFFKWYCRWDWWKAGMAVEVGSRARQVTRTVLSKAHGNANETNKVQGNVQASPDGASLGDCAPTKSQKGFRIGVHEPSDTSPLAHCKHSMCEAVRELLCTTTPWRI